MKTPLNHCASSMMHSEAWNEMRKNNSPNTTGNKEGIAHNKKMREAIGTFKMPHSPLHQNNKVKKDSLGKKDAWAKWEKGYMDRKYKFENTPYQKPITREENIKEMESERSEFMYDPKIGRIRLRKTDDADQPIERKSSMKNPFKINRQNNIEQAPDKLMGDIQKTYDENIAYAQNLLNKGKLSKENYQSFVEEEKAMVKDWRTRKAKEAGKNTPLDKKGEKDACYHKVKKAVKVWPSAYASGQLVQCRKRGASNWGVGKKK